MVTNEECMVIVSGDGSYDGRQFVGNGKLIVVVLVVFVEVVAATESRVMMAIDIIIMINAVNMHSD